MISVIYPALGRRGDFQKGLWIFSLAQKIWQVEDLLVTLSSHNISAGNPEGTEV